MTRGEQNNNPMNLRISTSGWKGKIVPSTDPDFEQFDTALDGIRAGAKNLLSYYLYDGLSTVESIIQRWAPDNENNTNAYVNDVCSFMSVRSDSSLDLTHTSTLESLVKAIIHHENGEIVYDNGLIEQAVFEALSAG